MVKQLVYSPSGVCSRQMIIDYEDDKIVNVKVIGGCNGNLQGISKLLVGMDIHVATSLLEGLRCGMKSTSCPDQIAKALKTIKD